MTPFFDFTEEEEEEGEEEEEEEEGVRLQAALTDEISAFLHLLFFRFFNA